MSDKFHAATCELRFGGEICTCGYVAPKTDKQIIEDLREQLKTEFDVAQGYHREIVSLKAILSFVTHACEDPNNRTRMTQQQMCKFLDELRRHTILLKWPEEEG